MTGGITKYAHTNVSLLAADGEKHQGLHFGNSIRLRNYLSVLKGPKILDYDFNIRMKWKESPSTRLYPESATMTLLTVFARGWAPHDTLKACCACCALF